MIRSPHVLKLLRCQDSYSGMRLCSGYRSKQKPRIILSETLACAYHSIFVALISLIGFIENPKSLRWVEEVESRKDSRNGR